MPNSRARKKHEPLKFEQTRVAAYCRVSTDSDEQLGSFESQKKYYEEKISSNKEWINVGIFADEAITGTKVDKRSGFQEMIAKCMQGEIDLILTLLSSLSQQEVESLSQNVKMGLKMKI